MLAQELGRFLEGTRGKDLSDEIAIVAQLVEGALRQAQQLVKEGEEEVPSLECSESENSQASQPHSVLTSR